MFHKVRSLVFRSLIVGAISAVGALGVAGPASAAVNVVGLQGDFSNASLVAGGGVGTTHRYVNAYPGVDAIVTATALSTNAVLDEMDGAGNNPDNRWLNSTFTFSGTNGQVESATYRLDFVLTGTSTPVTLNNVVIFVSDVDNDQFAQFTGISQYRISGTPTTRLTPSTAVAGVPAGSYRFQSDSTNTNANDARNWVEVSYTAVDSLSIVLGATVNGGAYFSIDFEEASWSAAATPATPSVVTPPATSYSLTYDPNGATAGSAPTSAAAAGQQTILGNTGSLTKTGLCFQGWNTAADGSGVAYAPTATINPTQNVTLYAQWGATNCYVASAPSASASASPSSSAAASASSPAASSTASTVDASLPNTGLNLYMISLLGGGAMAAIFTGVFLALKRKTAPRHRA